MDTLLNKLESLSPEKRLLIEQQLRKKLEEKSKGIRCQPRDKKTYPISYSQQRLWFLNQLDPGNPFYNIPASFRLKGNLSVSSLEKAFSYLIKRHETLRTTFKLSEGSEVVQEIGDTYEYTLLVEDLRGYAEAIRHEEALNLAKQLIGVPCDLEKGPLWRALLIRIDIEEYILALSFHHIIFDGWSLGIFIRELAELYETFLNKREPSDLDQKIQYVDYAVWHRGYFQGEVESKQMDYWKKQLSGNLPVLELPTDGVRPDVQTFKGSFHITQMPLELYHSLKRLSVENAVTLFMSTLAAFKVLLSRYCDQNDIIVGFPISGRNRSDIENVIGVFVNTIPLRTDLSGKPTFIELLKQVKEMSLGAYANQDVPFEQLVQAVQPERNLSYNPLFQVLFTYQNAIPPIELNELSVSFEQIDPGTSKFDLSLDIFEGSDEIAPSLVFEYNTDLFCKERIERMSEHYIMLIRSICDNPQLPVNKLEMLTAGERNRLLVEWDSGISQQENATIVNLFEKQAGKTPESEAVKFNDNKLLYKELNQKANQLAHYLIKLGVTPEVPVGISTERSLEMVLATLAVLKAGGAYVPLDPAYPIERLQYMLSDSRIPVLLCDCQIDKSKLDYNGKIIDLNVVWQDLDSECRENPGVQINPENLAYVIYTSGTTGNPKGTMVTHGNAASAYLAWESAYRLREDVTSHLQMASFSFDVCTGDMLRALLSGGKLVLCPAKYLLEPGKLYELMVEEKVDCAEFVPAVIRNLIAYLEEKQLKLDFMKLLIVGSDNWYVNEYKYFRSFIGQNTRLINSYGLTEATIDSTFFEANANEVPDAESVPIGKPFENTKIYILDANLQMVPIGISGEIYIGGTGVARGYLNNEKLTKERFINDPFSSSANARLYKTGDLARYSFNGNIELIGRTDYQVKIRGFRIELNEIESVLSSHGSVRECAVIAREDVKGDKRLVAYYVPVSKDKNALEGLIDELKDYLRKKLPEYMIPSAFVSLEAIPLTSNGKLNRKALPSPVFDNLISEAKYVAPRTLIEGMLEGIWGQAFNLQRVSVFEDFFQLGGHSLLAMQIVSQIRNIFKVDVPLQALFKTPTISGIAEVIAELQGKEKEYTETISHLPNIVPDLVNRYEPFPLTDVQQAYWVGRNDAFEFGNVTTHSYDEMETLDLDFERFENAWNKIIERHDMLRTIIRDDGLQQIIKTVPYYSIKILDLSNSSEEEIGKQISTVRESMSHQKLDVSKWPVFDVRATLLPDGVARIHFSTDALLWDALSFVTLIKELVMIYEDPNVKLTPLELSFRDYVIAENSIKKTERFQRAVEYWKQKVDSLPPAPELPMAKNPRSILNPKFTRYHKKLERDLWSKLKNKATRAGVTATGLFLSIYAEVLAAFSKRPSFSLNLTFLNRHAMHPQVNEIVGEFTSLVLLSVDNSSKSTFIERTRRIQEDLWNVLEHHDISGVQVLRELTRIHGGASDAKMPVVFTSALILPVPDQENSPMPMKPVYRDGVTQTSQVWLDCGIWEDTKSLLCNWDVVEELYPEGFLQEMYDSYWNLVERLAIEEDIWNKEVISLIPEAQLKAREVWNSTSAPLSDECLHTLFSKQAVLEPERAAIITSSKTLTYGNLYCTANRIARMLKDLGALPNQLIAVVMEKGWEQVAGVLAILNSGAAYLPIDPGLPKERMEYLLEHGDVSIILTQSWITQALDFSLRLKVIAVDTVNLDSYDDSHIELLQNPKDLAYVIFTSGSTGLPKGVMIDHQGAVNTILDVNNRFQVSNDDRIFALSNLNFDLSVYDIFGALAAGAAIVIPDEALKHDPMHWSYMVEHGKVTIWNSVPQLMSLFVEHLHISNTRFSPSLRLIMMSGDWIPLQLPLQINRLSENERMEIISLGGATEASIWSILYPIGEVKDEWQSIPYGKPMVNQTFHILNDFMESCPNWVTGHLYIGGIGLAKGYWKDEEKTNNSFVIHPNTGERIYRTGDLGRYYPDGNIEFLGREDNQVKIQGYRIELGEVESALKQYPAINDAVISVAGESKGNKTLVAYYVSEKVGIIESSDLRDFLLNRLPEYMVPSIFVKIERVPLTHNGKVDRRSLPSIDNTSLEGKNEFIQPRNNVESQIAHIWADILEVDKIGVFDNFFELGGDSMQSIRMVTLLKHKFKVELHLRKFFQNPSIAALAEYINSELMKGN